MLAVVVCLLAGLLNQNSLAREYQDLFPTPRGLAMGGALVASVDDRSSLSYNPAGLALIEESELRVPDLLLLQYSPDILDIYHKIKGIDTGGGGMGVVSALKDFDGSSASFGVDFLGIGWFRRQMAMSFNLFSMNASFRVRTPSVFFAKINARVTSDTGVSFGYAQPMYDNHFRLGFVARPILVRGGFDKLFQNQDIAQLSSIASQMGIGWGFDGDVGVQGNSDPIVMFGFKAKILAGAVAQNLLAQNFSRPVKSDINTSMPPLERRGSVGVALRLDETEAVTPTFNVDWREVGVKTDDWQEHLCMSTEVILKSRTWFRSILRAHYARGNWGGGIAGRLAFGEFEIGTYAVNLGRGTGVGPNRRSYASLSARW